MRSAPVNVNNDECPQIFAFKNVNECGAPLSSFPQQPLVLCMVNGVLVRALIDTGSNFESNLIHEVCKIMGIHKSRTTAYHPGAELDCRTGRTCDSQHSAAQQYF